MKLVLLLVGIVVVCGLTITVLGMRAPKDHETSLAQDYGVPAAVVYQLVRNYEQYPAWRTGVKSMVRDGGARYIEESGHGKIPYRIIEDRPHSKLVSKIDDPDLPFSGTWTFEIVDKGATSQLRITESGSVPNPLVRFFSTYVFSHEKTIRTYLADVARKLEGR